MQKFMRFGFVSAALCMMLNVSACANDNGGSAATQGGAGSASDGDVAVGESALTSRACKSCHGIDLSGAAMPYAGTMAYPANLTPDMETGMGEWDQATIAKAIMSGLDDEGAQLCPTMPLFRNMGMTDAEANSIAKYLKSIPAVSHMVPESSCPPIKDEL